MHHIYRTNAVAELVSHEWRSWVRTHGRVKRMTYIIDTLSFLARWFSVRIMWLSGISGNGADGMLSLWSSTIKSPWVCTVTSHTVRPIWHSTCFLLFYYYSSRTITDTSPVIYWSGLPPRLVAPPCCVFLAYTHLVPVLFMHKGIYVCITLPLYI